jgi:nucleoside-diphosphate-sugar epimerase
VFGASGAVGRFLLPALSANYKVFPVSRTARADWIRGDLSDSTLLCPPTECLVSLGPLDAFAAWLERQSETPRRIIALSSMSAESKRLSPDPDERDLAERLRVAETKLFELGAARDMACTIFRPTLIYGTGADRSLAPIARFAKRWHILPIPLGASGLRQPVHAADLAQACMAALDRPETHGEIYALGGGERLRFDALLWRLRSATPGWVLPLPIPIPLLRIVRRWLGSPFSTAAMLRLREPLIADNAPAQRDFAFAPRMFQAGQVLPPAE